MRLSLNYSRTLSNDYLSLYNIYVLLDKTQFIFRQAEILVHLFTLTQHRTAFLLETTFHFSS